MTLLAAATKIEDRGMLTYWTISLNDGRSYLASTHRDCTGISVQQKRGGKILSRTQIRKIYPLIEAAIKHAQA